MLVLTRNSEQSIVIGENIVVRILSVRGDRVRVGIAAPADVAIRREEVPPLPGVAPKDNLPNCIDDGIGNL